MLSAFIKISRFFVYFDNVDALLITLKKVIFPSTQINYKKRAIRINNTTCIKEKKRQVISRLMKTAVSLLQQKKKQSCPFFESVN